MGYFELKLTYTLWGHRRLILHIIKRGIISTTLKTDPIHD